jgi:hypothetical protein
VQAPFVLGDSATRVASTVTPLSVLVPFTNAHSFVVIADAFTVFVSSSDVFDDRSTVVATAFDVPKGTPSTVSVDPLSFVTEPNANPKFPLRSKPPAGGVRVPAGGAGRFGRVPPNRKPLVHEPFTGAEIVIRVAAITPLLFRDPVAMTHAPTFRLDLGADVCSVTLAEPADTFDLPVGLSDVVIVNVEPFTETTGPNTDPCTGAAAARTAAATSAIMINHLPSSSSR